MVYFFWFLFSSHFFTLRVCLQRASSCHYYLFTDVFLPLLLLLHLLLILIHLLHLPHLLSFTSSSEQHLSRLPLETYYRPLILLSCSYSSFKSSFLFLSPPDWCLHLMERNDVIPQESRNVRGLMSSSDGVIPQESRWPHMIVHPLKINLSDLCRQQFCTLMSILFNYWHIIKVQIICKHILFQVSLATFPSLPFVAISSKLKCNYMSFNIYLTTAVCGIWGSRLIVVDAHFTITSKALTKTKVRPIWQREVITSIGFVKNKVWHVRWQTR